MQANAILASRNKKAWTWPILATSRLRLPRDALDSSGVNPRLACFSVFLRHKARHSDHLSARLTRVYFRNNPAGSAAASFDDTTACSARQASRQLRVQL